MTRIRRAGLIGLSWGIAWAFAGLLPARLIAGQIDPEHIGGPLYAGFICGALFAELAGIASGRRRLDELSSSRAALSGAASGLFAGMLPFVIGDNGRYQAGWSLAIVATTTTGAGIVARRWLRERPILPTVTLVAVIAGVLAGALPWFLTTHDHLERLLPLALLSGVPVLGALSAVASRLLARWAQHQTSQVSAAGR
jgi:hypothetical protein